LQPADDRRDLQPADWIDTGTGGAP